MPSPAPLPGSTAHLFPIGNRSSHPTSSCAAPPHHRPDPSQAEQPPLARRPGSRDPPSWPLAHSARVPRESLEVDTELVVQMRSRTHYSASNVPAVSHINWRTTATHHPTQDTSTPCCAVELGSKLIKGRLRRPPARVLAALRAAPIRLVTLFSIASSSSTKAVPSLRTA